MHKFVLLKKLLLDKCIIPKEGWLDIIMTTTEHFISHMPLHIIIIISIIIIIIMTPILCLFWSKDIVVCLIQITQSHLL